MHNEATLQESTHTESQQITRSDRFVVIQSARFLLRHLERYGVLDCETWTIICWLLDNEVQHVLQKLESLLNRMDRTAFSREIESAETPAEDFPRIMAKYCQRIGGGGRHILIKACCRALDALVSRYSEFGKPEAAANIEKLRRMFHLSDLEIRLCKLAFVNTASDEVENFFVRHLRCNQISGHRYLLNLMEAGAEEVDAVLNGILKTVSAAS